MNRRNSATRSCSLAALLLALTASPVAADEVMYGMFAESHVFNPPVYVVYVKKQFTQNGVVEPNVYFMMNEPPPSDAFFIGNAHSEVQKLGGPFRTPADVAGVLPGEAVAWNTSMTQFVKNPAGRQSAAPDPRTMSTTPSEDSGYGPMAITIGIGAGLLLLGVAGWAIRALWLARGAQIATIGATAAPAIGMTIREFVTKYQGPLLRTTDALLKRSREAVSLVTDIRIKEQVREFLTVVNNGLGRMASMDELREIAREIGVQFSDDLWRVIELSRNAWK